MKKNYVTTLLLAFSAFYVFAQDNFVPGAVINSNGDTLRGLINDRRWHNSPPKIDFKRSDGSTLTFDPSSSNGFQIKDKSTYLCTEVSYDSTSIKIDEMTATVLPGFRKKRVFLKYVVKSKLSLLTFSEDDRLHLFVQKGTVVEELINHKYRNARYVFENRIYIEQLRRYFSDCVSMSVAEDQPYNTSSLTKLFIKYNECGENKTEIFNDEDKTLVTGGVTTFASWDQFRPNFEGGIGYGLGGFLNISFPDNNYDLSLYNELVYRMIGKQTNTIDKTAYSELRSFQLSSIIRWRLIPTTSRLLIGGGIAFSKGINYSSTDLVKIDVAIVADVCLKVSDHGLVDLRFQSEDTDLNYTPKNRSTSLRLSFGWQF